ncbi:unnamed protein product [Pleuronectes platessa]|uniref:Uncharacterized protein n=1 Tax=Pleuronectes platessa TaxID=8262 RepID=A0A9N7TXE2_PLEPL|nr:unnamed protein product [Pleuronectes platessa]
MGDRLHPSWSSYCSILCAVAMSRCSRPTLCALRSSISLLCQRFAILPLLIIAPLPRASNHRCPELLRGLTAAGWTAIGQRDPGTSPPPALGLIGFSIYGPVTEHRGSLTGGNERPMDEV